MIVSYIRGKKADADAQLPLQCIRKSEPLVGKRVKISTDTLESKTILQARKPE
jgi:hypothetical protein